MMKRRLLTPGPTMVPEKILATMAEPVIHHRMPAFKKIMESVQKKMQWIFQTKNDVILLASSGTGAMEATMVNLHSPGDTVLTINCGKFGARWGKIAKAYGLNLIELTAPSGQVVAVSEITKALKANPAIKAVYWQASETSTGAELDNKEILKAVKANSSALCVVDAITALGVIPLPMDEWGIDVLITGSQKALMVPPGVAALAFSEKAWQAAATAKLPKFYFDLNKERAALKKGQTSWTPATTIIHALNHALEMMEEEGLENLFKRHDLLAKATRAGVKALGLELFAGANPSTAVTSVIVPSTISDGKLIPKMMRDDLGVTISGGQDELEGKIFRLTHLGYIDQFDVITGIAALELTLHRLGHQKFQFGAGTGAALKVFNEGK